MKNTDSAECSNTTNASMHRDQETTRRKALLAIAFTAAILNAPAPTFCATEVQPTDSVVDQIIGSKNATADLKAFQLLGLAENYLSGRDAAEVEKAYSGIGNRPVNHLFMHNWERILKDWAYRDSQNDLHGETGQRPVPKENVALANAAIQSAIAQLDQSSDQFAKLHLYYIAGRLFQESGNERGASSCKHVVNQVIQLCKLKEGLDEQQTTAVVSILNVMAYSFIPLRIPEVKRSDASWNKEMHLQPFTHNNYKRAEELKRLAVTIADRLPATHDLRRRTHRDLVFWYQQLGKPALAAQHKQILFALVGINDDSILFPLVGSCGHLIWWEQKTKTRTGHVCGMG